MTTNSTLLGHLPAYKSLALLGNSNISTSSGGDQILFDNTNTFKYFESIQDCGNETSDDFSENIRKIE